MSDILKKVASLSEEKGDSLSLPKSRIQMLNESMNKNQNAELKEREETEKNFQRIQNLERLRVSKNQMIGTGGDQNNFETMTKARLRKVIRREIRHFVKPVMSVRQRKAIFKFMTDMFKKKPSGVVEHPSALAMPSGSILNYHNRRRWRKVVYRAVRKIWQLLILGLIILGIFSVFGYDLFSILEQFSSL